MIILIKNIVNYKKTETKFLLPFICFIINLIIGTFINIFINIFIDISIIIIFFILIIAFIKYTRSNISQSCYLVRLKRFLRFVFNWFCFLFLFLMNKLCIILWH